MLSENNAVVAAYGFLLCDAQACPWECHSWWNPMGNVPWDGMGQAQIAILWDGNGTDKYVPWTTLGLSMGMSFLWESHGKRPMEWNGMGQAKIAMGWEWDRQICPMDNPGDATFTITMSLSRNGWFHFITNASKLVSGSELGVFGSMVSLRWLFNCFCPIWRSANACKNLSWLEKFT